MRILVPRTLKTINGTKTHGLDPSVATYCKQVLKCNLSLF